MRVWIDKLLNGVHRRRTVLISIDILCFAVVSWFFYLISSTAANSLPVDEFMTFAANVAVHLVLLLVVRSLFGVYNHVWRYANTSAYFNLVLADAVAGVASVLLLRVLQPGGFPWPWWFPT